MHHIVAEMSLPVLAAMLVTMTPVCGLTSPSCQYDEDRHFLNCSSRGLTGVPVQEFPVGVRGIDLSFNNIRQVKNWTFVNTSALEYLDLSDNPISSLHSAAFEGLGNLLCLNLSGNDFTFSPKILTPELFAPLQKLSVLRILRFVGSPGLWPGTDAAFGKLKSLTTLYLDLGMYFIFGPGFRHLTKLRTISTPGGDGFLNACSSIGIIHDSTFSVFWNISLKELRLNYCGIASIESRAFEPLTSLEILDLSNNAMLGVRSALKSLSYFQGRNMTEINFSMLNRNLKYDTEQFELADSDFTYLRNICVKSVNLAQNFITGTDRSRNSKFRLDCLERLNMSHHALQDVPLPFVESLSSGTALKYLDFSNGYSLPSDQQDTASNMFSADIHVLVSLPQSITWFSLSHFARWSSWEVSFAINPDTSLSFLGVAYTSNAKCDKPWVYGVQNVTSVDLSGAICKKISQEYFEEFRSLNHLVLRDTPNMDVALMSPTHPFGLLDVLENIDLSGNKLTDVHPELFQNNTQLRSMLLANNKLQRLPMAVFSIPDLHKLDLSSNAFTHLVSDEMRLFDRWLTRAGSFQLVLGDNPLQCTCETVLFIRWILQRKDIMNDPQNYICLLSNGTKIPLFTFGQHLSDFEVKCVSDTYLVISVVGSLTFLILILFFIAVYRYRVNLRYWLYTTLKPPEDMFVDREYIYDAFIAYTSDEYEWVIRQVRPTLELVEDPIRLCVHDRDFIPGKPIHENIVDKIRESRKIVLIISPGFLDSTYGPLEIEYAGMKCLEEGRDDIIVCVLMEEIPVRQMPRALRNLWHKITFLKWSPEPQEQIIFWRNLKAALRHDNGRH